MSAIPTAAAEFRRHWGVLLAMIVGVAFGVSSLCFYTLGAFIGPLMAAKGWDRAAISGALTTAITLPLIAPVLGRLVDAGRTRALVISGHVLLAAGFVAMTQIGGAVWQLWAIYGLIFLVAGGSSPIGYTRLLVSRFTAGRGLALGLCMSGTGLTALVGPRAVTQVILDHGWKGGYLLLAAASLCAIPIVLLALRGDPAPGGPAALARVAPPTRLDAREQRLLWGLLLLFFANALAVTGLVVHLIPFLHDVGVPPLEAATIAGVVGIAVIATRVLIGFLLDRLPPAAVMAGATSLTGLGVLALAAFGADGAWIGALALGLSLGAEIDLIAFFVARLFPDGAYGYAYSRGYGAFIFGSALSPVLAGMVRSATGSYVPFLLGSVVVLLACAGGVLLLPDRRAVLKLS